MPPRRVAPPGRSLRVSFAQNNPAVSAGDALVEMKEPLTIGERLLASAQCLERLLLLGGEDRLRLDEEAVVLRRQLHVGRQQRDALAVGLGAVGLRAEAQVDEAAFL